MKVAVIGGGAAGFFAAFSVKKHHTDAKVSIIEKSNKVLAKVKVSGGGRCNVTHNCSSNSLLSKHYPRGEKFMRKALEQFTVVDTVKWFEQRNVALKTETDNRMFPTTDNSETIIECFLNEASRLGIQVQLSSLVSNISVANSEFLLDIDGLPQRFEKVIVATGGSPKRIGFYWLESIGHGISGPVPSLFTFNIPHNPITELMGVSVLNSSVRIVGQRHQYFGPLLITHWGLSGPAVLKTSAFAARDLANVNYHFECAINWLGVVSEHQLRLQCGKDIPAMTKRKISNRNPFELPNRLWEFLLNKVQIPPERTWGEIGSKQLNRLVNVLVNDTYRVKGKTTFKEEFVTAGGVSLDGVHHHSLKSKCVDGLYFAGEVLDIDGVTGGFNFQAAWTTGFIAGQLK